MKGYNVANLVEEEEEVVKQIQCNKFVRKGEKEVVKWIQCSTIVRRGKRAGEMDTMQQIWPNWI